MLTNPYIQAFLQKNLAIDAAITNASGQPLLARGLAAKIVGHQLLVFIDRQLGKALLDQIAQNQNIAIALCWPTAEEAIQIKGQFDCFAPVTNNDLALIKKHCDGFVDDVSQNGYERTILQAYKHFEPDNIVALALTPSAIFVQTPGAQAGSSLNKTGLS